VAECDGALITISIIIITVTYLLTYLLTYPNVLTGSYLRAYTEHTEEDKKINDISDNPDNFHVIE